MRRHRREESIPDTNRRIHADRESLGDIGIAHECRRGVAEEADASLCVHVIVR